MRNALSATKKKGGKPDNGKRSGWRLNNASARRLKPDNARSKSARRPQLFPDDHANEHFLELLESMPERFGLRIHALC
jgi:hypothetical protein